VAKSQGMVRRLLGMEAATEAQEDSCEAEPLGSARTLAEFESHCGVKHAAKKISLRARRGGQKYSSFIDGDPAESSMAPASVAAALPLLGLLPGKAAEVIQMMTGGDAATPSSASASSTKAKSASFSPPKLLQTSPERLAALKLLRQGDIEALHKLGFCVIDKFLEDRCYASCGRACASGAPQLVLQGAKQVPVRPAKLGKGDRMWSNAMVRGDEMTWLSAPQGAGLRDRAEQRVRDGLPHNSLAAGGGAKSLGVASEFDAMTMGLRSAFGGSAPEGERSKLASIDGSGTQHDSGKEDAAVANDSPHYKELDVLLAQIVELQAELDSLDFGCTRLSLMLARYPGGGARYAKHLDANPESTEPQRRITAVYYLNADWKPADGGCLRVHLLDAVARSVREDPATGACVKEPEGRAAEFEPPSRHGSESCALDIEPLMDRLILFSSAWLEHEVVPAHADRFAITSWFY